MNKIETLFTKSDTDRKLLNGTVQAFVNINEERNPTENVKHYNINRVRVINDSTKKVIRNFRLN